MQNESADNLDIPRAISLPDNPTESPRIRTLRAAGLKSVLVRGVRGNSAWGRRMRALKANKHRWEKVRQGLL